MTRVALSALLLLVAASAVLAVEKYTDQYDKIDVDDILHNDRLYIKYFACLRGQGKCTPDGAELKEHIPDALKDNCSKCTDAQKRGAEKVLRFIIKEKKDDYKILEEMYDPTGIYRKKYESEKAFIEEGKPLPAK